MILTFLKLLTSNEKKFLLILIFLMILTSLLEVIGIGSIPVFVMTLMDQNKIYEILNLENNFLGELNKNEMLLLLSGLIFIIFFIKNIIFIITNILQYNYLKNYIIRISKTVFLKYIKKNSQFHLNTNPAYIIRNLTAETDSTKLYLLSLINIFRDLILIFLVTTFLFIYNFYITLVSLSFLMITSYIYYYFFVSKLDLIGKKNLAAKAEQIKSINNSFWLIKLIKLHNKSDYFLNKFFKAINTRYSIDAQIAKYKSINKPFVEITGVALLVIIIIFASIYNYIDNLFVLVVTYAVALSRIAPLFASINANLNAIKFYSPSLQIIIDLLEKKDHTQIHKNVFSFNEEIKLKNITFKYENTSSNILKDINLEINKYDVIGIFGKTGSGKSTILNLILGLIKPSSGNIYLDGNQIHENDEFLISNAGYIPQDNLLIDDTILSNIAFGTDEKDFDFNKLNNCIILAQLNDFIKSLPDGLNTVIGERGIRLSGGQIQRISIARALYFNCELLVMDEATSALDNNTESEFIESVELLKGKKTIIIVSHRHSIMKLCNKIFCLKDKSLDYVGNYIEFQNTSLN